MVKTHVRNEVRERVSSYFTDFITYVLTGNHFISWLYSTFPNELNGEFFEVPQTTELNDELFNSFVDKVTDHVCNRVGFKEYKVTEQPVKSFRVEIGDEFFDVYLSDVNDLSSLLMVTDQHGDVVDYKKWDYITEILRKSL
jgi:hypothetical protein